MKESKLAKLEHQTWFLKLIEEHRESFRNRRKSISLLVLDRIPAEILLKKLHLVDPESILEIAFGADWNENDSHIKVEIARSIALKVPEIFSETLLSKYYSNNGIVVSEIITGKTIKVFIKEYF